MSVQAMARVWQLDLPPMEQHVLHSLADHADHLGRNIYPAIALIAWKTNLSEKQVRRYIHALVERSILKVERPGGGRGHTTVYSFDLTAGPEKPAFGGQGNTPIIKGGLSVNTPTVTGAFTRETLPHTGGIKTNTPIALSTFTDNPPILGSVSQINPPNGTINPPIQGRNTPIAMGGEPINRQVKPSSSSSRASARHDRMEEEEEEEEKNEGDDEGDTDDGIDPYELHREEADRPNVRRDLVDALIAFGIYPGSALTAVMAGTVATDRDVIRCKRSGLSPGVVWKEYLSQAKLPPLPDDGTSTVSQEQIAIARRLLAETDKRNADGDELVSRFRPITNPLKSMNGTTGGIVRPPEGFWK